MISILAGFLLVQQHPLKPPFARLWTIRAVDQMDQIEGYERDGDLVAYAGFQSFGVADIRTGKRLWEHALKEKNWSSEVAFAGDLLLVSVGNDRLYAYRPRTGKEVWSVPRTGFASPIGVSNGVVLQELSLNRISAIRTRDHKVVWTALVDPHFAPKKKEEANPSVAARPLFGPGEVYISTFQGAVVCLDLQNGRRLWSTSGSRSGGANVVASDSTIFTANDHDLTAISRSGGKILWHAMAAGSVRSKPALANGRLYVLTEIGHLQAFRADSGKVLLDEAVAPAQSFAEGGISSDSTGIYLGLLQGDFRHYSFDGQLQWETKIGDAPTNPPMEHWDGRFLVAQGRTLSMYGPGPIVAKDAREQANKLAAKIGSLDSEDYIVLKKLGEVGFQAVFPRFKAALFDYAEAARKNPKSAENEFERLERAGDALEEVMSPPHSKELIALLSNDGSDEATYPIFKVLAAGGDAKLAVPTFVSFLKRSKKDPDGRSAESVASSYLLQSKDPMAVKFLIDEIKDPLANPDLRSSAYADVAGNGGPAEARLVLSLRSKRRTLPELAYRMDLAALGLKPGSKTNQASLIATKQDSSGVVWGLLMSGVSGADSDMWIAHLSAGHWVDPLFTGFMSERFQIKRGEPEIETYNGQSKDQLINGAWFEQFVGNPAITEDSDHDGLNNLIEARFQTDTKSADSDGDGIPDGKDATPNAPERAMSDPEKVMAAAFEARYHSFVEIRASAPALFMAPEGVKPFELIGWPGPVVWASPGTNPPLAQCYGSGIAIIRFDPLPEAELLPKGSPATDRFIHWNKNRSEAELTISTYFGALAGTGYLMHVKRFGQDWVVTSMRMSFIS